VDPWEGLVEGKGKMKERLLGIFTSLGQLEEAIPLIQRKGAKVRTVYSPIDCREILEKIGVRKTSPVRFATLLGGLAGLSLGVGFAIYTFLEWKFVTSGKPTPPAVPLVVVGFEMTILFGFLSTLLCMLFLCGLPRLRGSQGYDPRFSKDRFGLLLECDRAQREEIEISLEQAGAEEVRVLRTRETSQ
jgi:molybdopterin-containing oxidoreductase family membrane subunit